MSRRVGLSLPARLDLPLTMPMRLILTIFDPNSDYLIVDPHQAIATGLAALVEGHVARDASTRRLGEQTYGSAQRWQVVKPLMCQIQRPDGVLSLDDTLEGKVIKGINQLMALYPGGQNWLPVAFHLIHKDQQRLEPETGKVKWTSWVSKPAYLRQLAQQCVSSQRVVKYVLADSWLKPYGLARQRIRLRSRDFCLQYLKDLRRLKSPSTLLDGAA